MAVASYKYTSDSGSVYQIVLPDTFASALGYVLADGSEPYIPAQMSPRYASYIDPSVPLFFQAVITNPSLFASPPANVFAGGYGYQLRSMIGESTQGTPGGNYILASGPQGPKGDTGAQGPQGPQGIPGVSAWNTASNSGGTVTYNSTGVNGVTVTPPSGTYLVLGTCTYTPSATTATGFLLTITSGGTVTGLTAAQPNTADTRTRTQMINAFVQVNGSQAINLFGQSGNAGVNYSSVLNASRLNYLKLA